MQAQPRRTIWRSVATWAAHGPTRNCDARRSQDRSRELPKTINLLVSKPSRSAAAELSRSKAANRVKPTPKLDSPVHVPILDPEEHPWDLEISDETVARVVS